MLETGLTPMIVVVAVVPVVECLAGCVCVCVWMCGLGSKGGSGCG